MQVAMEDILVRERVRQDMGDIKPLMTSMQEHGQLNPITLSREHELIAGHRRVLAARELGWKSIEAYVVDRASEVDKLQLELEENVHRKDFSPEELLAGYRRLEKLQHPSLPRRIKMVVQQFFSRLFRRRKPKPSAPASESAARETTVAPEPASENNNKKPAAAPEQEPDVIGNQYGV